jgi:hypothetical protein
LGTFVFIDSIPAVDGALTYILAAGGVPDVLVYSSTAAVDPAVAVFALLVSLLFFHPYYCLCPWLPSVAGVPPVAGILAVVDIPAGADVLSAVVFPAFLSSLPLLVSLLLLVPLFLQASLLLLAFLWLTSPSCFKWPW